MFDFLTSDRFFKTLDEPKTAIATPEADPTAELRAQIEALKAELESIKASTEPGDEPESEPEPEKVPLVEPEPPTAPLVTGSGQLDQFLKLPTRNPRSLGSYYQENGDVIREQIKQLLEA